MHTFWIRLISILGVLGILLGYHSILDQREKSEEIAKLTAQLETAQNQIDTYKKSVTKPLAGESEDEAAKEGAYVDGIYTGEGDGFGGTISVSVTIEDGAIAGVEVVNASGEDGAYLTMAEEMLPEFVEAQSAEADTISGATFSSTGIKNAVKQALEKAVS